MIKSIQMLLAIFSVFMLHTHAHGQLKDKELAGLWSTLSLNNGITEEADGRGEIRFYPDHTFQVTSGKNTLIIGCGAADCTGAMGVWSIKEDAVIMLQLNGLDPMNNSPYSKSWAFVMEEMGKKLLLVRGSNQMLMSRIRK